MQKIKLSKSALAYVALISVVLIWSLSPIVSNLDFVKNNYSPGMIITLRALFATLALAVINGKKLKGINKEYFKVAVPSGIILAAATLCQMVGYRYEAAPGESAFLENISVIVIPILLFLFTRKAPSFTKILAAILCFIGGAIIALAGSSGNLLSVSLGKWLACISGVMYGVNIVVTSLYTKKLDAGVFVFIQLAIQTVAAFAYSFIGEKLLMADEQVFAFTFEIGPLVTVALLGIIATGICWTLRTHSLQNIPVMIVSVIMPFSAVLTGVWSVLLGMESLTWNLLVGGGIIVAAILIAEVFDTKEKKQKQQESNAETLKEPLAENNLENER